MNVIDVLTYGQQDIEHLLDRLRATDWDVVALGVWTTKDLVGHLGAYEVRFADVLATFLDEPTTSDMIGADLATFNDVQAALRRDWPVDAVVGELRTANGRAMAFARRIASDDWSRVGTIPWYGPEYALDDLAVYTMYGHKREHGPQLDAVLGRADRA